VLTVRARAGDSLGPALDFREPGWGVQPLSCQSPGQRRLLVHVDDEASLRRLMRVTGRRRRRGRVLKYADRLWMMSAGGRVQVRPRMPVRTAEDVALAYAPGVGRLAARIAADPATADAVGAAAAVEASRRGAEQGVGGRRAADETPVSW
jgi:malate dehydrogenase (oxaloacetate-decarboxylating)